MYTELIIRDTKVIPAPYFKKYINFIGLLFAAAVSDTITFAAAPIIVILPPRQAPSDRHHHKG